MWKNSRDFLLFSHKIASNKIYREVYILENKDAITYIIQITIIAADIKTTLKFNFYKLYRQVIFIKRINNKV